MILISTEITQQTFALMKTSWRRLWSLSSEDVFKTSSTRLDQDEVFALLIRLQKTSWSRSTYSSWSYVFKTFSRRLQDVFKTSSELLQDVLKTSSRHLQHVFKTYYQVKVFLVRHFQDIFETYLKRSWDVLLRWLSAGGFPRSHFREIYGHCAKSPRVTKISQVLVFHFTAPFSGFTLQRRI